ncbi:SDR family NAD(P)-dependent oxidoreductase [Aeromicrobium sp. 9AM]|uniref:SDR family NAD(P)-dependent oxidoreductase n=1 Tax=Aeromicrobium sp. 9AM TaxID=2653126 RepID=UPI0012F154B4|nr:SDR family oxidoreductase [Aeromicrobium sp. 9AM]VXB62750.1 Short-chain dehydrogenase/reductase SDR family protein [Aeromicrobium sp. 9AM]
MPGSRPVALVTGGGSGIGLASAEALARAGHDVTIVGRRPAALAEAAAQVRAAAREATVLVAPADVGARDEVEGAFAATLSTFGRLDVFVGAAAALHTANFRDLTIEGWDEMVDVVLRGSAMCAMAATRHFVQAGGGRVIFIGSISASVSDFELAHYCAAKAGVHALARSMAVDLASANIWVNVVAPGWVNTPMIGEYVDSLEAGVLLAMNPQGRAARPAEIADVVRFLAVDAPPFLTGSTITVDGGQTVMNHLLPG